MIADQWKSLMQRIGTHDNTEMFETLIEKYSEKHRYYHTLEHIKLCLTLLEQNQPLAKNPEEIELAIWFHDAIYNIFSSTNEKDSAKMASDFLLKANFENHFVTRVAELIMATGHGIAPSNSDQALLVDIDLSVLGCNPKSYTEFEIAIRKEYKKIPLFIFRKGRKKILSNFLHRERIYTFPEFYDAYEAQARANIMNAINAL